MSAPRRRNLNPLPPLQPESCGTPMPTPQHDHYESLVAELGRMRTTYAVCRNTLRAERKRAGSVEAVLVRHIASLEQQVNDLRSAYFTNLAMPTAPNPNPKVSKQ
jgi:hypothetical protein